MGTRGPPPGANGFGVVPVARKIDRSPNQRIEGGPGTLICQDEWDAPLRIGLGIRDHRRPARTAVVRLVDLVAHGREEHVVFVGRDRDRCHAARQRHRGGRRPCVSTVHGSSMPIVTDEIDDASMVHGHVPDVVGDVVWRGIDVTPSAAGVIADRQACVGTDVDASRRVRVDADAKRRRLLTTRRGSVRAGGRDRCRRMNPRAAAIAADVDARQTADLPVVERRGVNCTVVRGIDGDVPCCRRHMTIQVEPGDATVRALVHASPFACGVHRRAVTGQGETVDAPSRAAARPQPSQSHRVGIDVLDASDNLAPQGRARSQQQANRADCRGEELTVDADAHYRTLDGERASFRHTGPDARANPMGVHP